MPAFITQPDKKFDHEALIAGPVINLHQGKYRVTYTILPFNNLSDGDEVSFEIFQDWGGKKIDEKILKKNDFEKGKAKEVSFLLDIQKPTPLVEFRVCLLGKQNIYFKKVELDYLSK